ncbi:MAG: hypothetical protein EPN70_18715 [Paraburkholderia sp.]|uniref:hypothetical protein n=1 Tax=Paraburkholderia sp. TaxID=1926495 RepID=UPI001224F4F4|nr:hypothetical protein [Paraburkholderia sp.]TAM01739.1 MAG: hypothetical protein EPN70_18715 [Paraburkholderia sp.]TAM27428.1 MAG: hypothetical protein EPN59_19460 [Paraburkholderia sp.]
MKHPLVIGLALLLVACGTARTVVLEPARNHDRFSGVELVESEATVTVPPEVTAKMRSVIEKGLYENGAFTRGKDLRIVYTIVSNNPGNQFQRWLLGGIGNAGEGSLVVMVRYLDTTDTELAKTEVEGKIGSGFFGGSYEEAVTKAGEDIVKYTIQNFGSH